MGKRKDIERAFASLGAAREINPRLPALEAYTDNASLANYLKQERQALLHRILTITSSGGLRLAQEFSDLMDAVLSRMFTLACQRIGVCPEETAIAIVATGGYGRRELCPFSDLDITFIPIRDGEPTIERLIRDMFSQVMDIFIERCHLEVGYAYRLKGDCGALDHQTVSGLLDARLVTGNQRLFIQFEDAFWTNFNPTEFIFAKVAERRQILQKWGYLARVIEPQLKEGPGGLRDIQTMVWLMQAKAHLAAARVRGDRAFSALVREEYLSPAEADRIQTAKELLFRARNALHALTGAERDQLVVTRQEAIAQYLGYTPETGTPPVERFMSDLYPALASVRRAADRVMREVENSRLILGIGLDCKRRQIIPANEALVSEDPIWMLWACELAQRYQLELSDALERSILALVETHPLLADSHQAGKIFNRILLQKGRVYTTLQRMADLGILGWLLPEFQKTMDLIAYDPSHEYTVGQHTLRVIQELEALLQPSEGEELDDMRRLIRDIPHPEQLMMAALLHDCGKAIPDTPHSESGEKLAEAICRRLGWNQEATSNVRFLVRHHLLMAETSRLRDPGLEETIRDFTRIVNDADRLNMLYLLTYADTRAVGAGVWTQVKGRFLNELWRRSLTSLSEQETFEQEDIALARATRRLRKELSLSNCTEEEVEEHIRAMPSHYLLSQSLNEIALHISFVRRVRADEVVVDFHEERNATYTELTLCTFDDPVPGLLAKITGVLYAAGLDVHAAQVTTRVSDTDRIALDTLWVDYRGRPLSPGKRRKVSDTLIAVLSGKKSLEEVLKQPASPFTPRTRNGTEKQTFSENICVSEVRNDISEHFTVIETSGSDTRSALFRVARALSHLGWDIRSARVSLWRGVARTSFYVEGARHLSEDSVRSTLNQVLQTEEGTRAESRSSHP